MKYIIFIFVVVCNLDCFAQTQSGKLHNWNTPNSPIASFIPNKFLGPNTDETHFQVLVKTLEKSQNICKSFPFSNELAASSCGGVLISNRHVLTDDKCLDFRKKIQPDLSTIEIPLCPNTFFPPSHDLGGGSKIVFNFGGEFSLGKPLEQYNVFSCKRVVSYVRDTAFNGVGYAIIELDREVTHIQPIEIDFTKLQSGSKLDLIVTSSPEGISPKFEQINNWEYSDRNLSFVQFINSYNFSLSLGMPIIDKSTNKLIGINSTNSGNSAFQLDPNMGCKKLMEGGEPNRFRNMYMSPIFYFKKHIEDLDILN